MTMEAAGGAAAVSQTMEPFKLAVLQNDHQRAQEVFPDEWAEGASVLHVVAMLGFDDLLQHILTNGDRDLNEKDSSGWTPLMNALVNKHHSTAHMLLETQKCDLTLTDNFQQTCLHIEAQSPCQNAKIAEMLISQGAPLETEDTEGMTPFLRAIESNNVDVARLLYKNGAYIHGCNHSGLHALHTAVYHHHMELLDWLLELRCAVNVIDNHFQTPLMHCVQSRHHPAKVFHIMKVLVIAGAQVNLQDCQGNTALLLALSNPAIVKKPHINVLLCAGADPNIPNRDGLTPIWQAVYDGLHYPDRMKIIQLLLYQNCYLDMSCRGKLLFQSGNDTVYCYENYLSPLEVAIDSRYHKAAKMLLHAGCLVRPDLWGDMRGCEIPEDLMWFQDILVNPHSLLQQCRLVIRKVLGQHIEQKVQQLPLPESLKKCILLCDVIVDTDS